MLLDAKNHKTPCSLQAYDFNTASSVIATKLPTTLLTHSHSCQVAVTFDALGLTWLATHHTHPCRLRPHLHSSFYILHSVQCLSRVALFPAVYHNHYVFSHGLAAIGQAGPEVIKLFKLTQLSTKFQLLIQLSTKFQLLLKTKIPTNDDVSCLNSLRCSIYHADKC